MEFSEPFNHTRRANRFAERYCFGRYFTGALDLALQQVASSQPYQIMHSIAYTVRCLLCQEIESSRHCNACLGCYAEVEITSTLLSRNLDLVNIRNPQRLFLLSSVTKSRTHLIEATHTVFSIT